MVPFEVSSLLFLVEGGTMGGSSVSENGCVGGAGDTESDYIYVYMVIFNGKLLVMVSGDFMVSSYVSTDCGIEVVCVAEGSVYMLSVEVGEIYFLVVDGVLDSSGAYMLEVVAIDVDVDLICEDYCTRVQLVCMGDYVQYESVDACVTYCVVHSQFFLGSLEDESGNMVGCRLYYVGVVLLSELSIHCFYVGLSGGDVCGFWCDVYCDLVVANCTEDSVLYVDTMECQIVCGGFSMDGAFGVVGGDIV